MAGYGTDEGFNAWLSGQGLTLPVGAPTPAILRQIGSDYVDAAYGPRLKCSKPTGGFEQERAWPRAAHRVNGESVPDTLIPQVWVNASYRAAYLQATNPGWATGTTDPSRSVKRERVEGAVEVEYFGATELSAQANSASGVTTDALIDAMVTPFLCAKGRTLDNLMLVV